MVLADDEHALSILVLARLLLLGSGDCEYQYLCGDEQGDLVVCHGKFGPGKFGPGGQIPRDDVLGIWSEGLNFLENMVLPQGIWSGQRHGEI